LACQYVTTVENFQNSQITKGGNFCNLSKLLRINTFQNCAARMQHDDDLFTLATNFEPLDTLPDTDDGWLAEAVIKLKGLATAAVTGLKVLATLVQVDDFDFVVFSW